MTRERNSRDDRNDIEDGLMHLDRSLEGLFRFSDESNSSLRPEVEEITKKVRELKNKLSRVLNDLHSLRS